MIAGLQLCLQNLVALCVNWVERHIIEIQRPSFVGDWFIRKIGNGVVKFTDARLDIVLPHLPMNGHRWLLSACHKNSGKSKDKSGESMCFHEEV